MNAILENVLPLLIAFFPLTSFATLFFFFFTFPRNYRFIFHALSCPTPLWPDPLRWQFSLNRFPLSLALNFPGLCCASSCVGPLCFPSVNFPPAPTCDSSLNYAQVIAIPLRLASSSTNPRPCPLLRTTMALNRDTLWSPYMCVSCFNLLLSFLPYCVTFVFFVVSPPCGNSFAIWECHSRRSNKRQTFWQPPSKLCKWNTFLTSQKSNYVK